MDATTALAIYRAEKDKALRERRVSHVQLMAEAQEAFRKMLADAQLARKGGRPKGSTNAASAPPVPAVSSQTVGAAVPSKLVLKTTKPAPAKAPEKVTAAAVAAPKTRIAKVADARPATKAPKRSAESRRPTAKASAPKAAKRAAAPAARKGSAKKAPAPRKQAAARERSARGRKR